MKKGLTLLTLIFFISGPTVLNAQNAAVEYLDKIGEHARSIQKDMWDYTNAVSHGKRARKVEKKRTQLIETSENALKSVRAMDGFNGSTAYRDSVASYLEISLHVLKEDYAKIVDMEEIAERSYDNMEAYLLAKEEAGKKREKAFDILIESEKKFAEENDIELTEGEDTELSKKMKIAAKVYDYYNEVYLIFFKSYIQEVYLVEAIGKNDVSGIEQNKNALLSTAEEGLKKLDAMDPFDEDRSLLDACKMMLEFYKDEAENKIGAYTDYLIKTEDFKSIKASFDQIKEKKRTQDDIDKYNNAINELNAAVERYNKTNEELNKAREEKLEDYNKTAEKFTDKHVPKGRAK